MTGRLCLLLINEVAPHMLEWFEQRGRLRSFFQRWQTIIHHLCNNRFPTHYVRQKIQAKDSNLETKATIEPRLCSTRDQRIQLTSLIMQLPSLKLSAYIAGSESQKEAFCKELFTALSTSGFVKLTDHGFSKEIIESLFHWISQALFNQLKRLPYFAKQYLNRTRNSLPFRLPQSSKEPIQLSLIHIEDTAMLAKSFCQG